MPRDYYCRVSAGEKMRLQDRPGGIYSPPPEYDREDAPVASKSFKFYAEEALESTKLDVHLPAIFWALSFPAKAKAQHEFLEDAVMLLAGTGRGKPESLRWARWFAWVDLRLLDAYPELAEGEEEEPLRCADYLVSFNRAEGFIQDALDAARLAARLGHMEDVLEELEQEVELDRA